jgi:hypothetical protein
MDIQQSLIDGIHLGDRAGANALLDAWAAEHGHEHLLTEVLDPTLILIGEEWCSSETFTRAQMYVAAKVTEHVLGKIAAQRVRERTRDLERRNYQLEQMNKAFVGWEI